MELLKQKQNMVITVSDSRQTLADIAIQHLGSIEGVYELATLNSLSVTDCLHSGQEITLPPVINNRVVNYYRDSEIFPATSINE